MMLGRVEWYKIPTAAPEPEALMAVFSSAGAEGEIPLAEGRSVRGGLLQLQLFWVFFPPSALISKDTWLLCLFWSESGSQNI